MALQSAPMTSAARPSGRLSETASEEPRGARWDTEKLWESELGYQTAEVMVQE
jgi:hypothetical protein